MYIYLKACCKVKQNNFKTRYKTYLLYTAFINICLLKYKDLEIIRKQPMKNILANLNLYILINII